jgi:hypothetical protein
MAKRKYNELKTIVRKEIISQFGSLKSFIDQNPDLGYKEANLCNRLRPDTGINLHSLEEIVGRLELKLILAKN